jgi:myo-inositol 2-dehydrogenase/D-chiro-inositol 1-dehydrogenase
VKESIRIGVIGAGTMGQRHCQILAQHVPGAELAGVADIDEAAARRAAAFGRRAVATRDYQELLGDSSIRAVVVASPNDTHTRVVEEAAQAGKHIFCEKPIGLDLASTDAALAAVARQGVKLQVGFQRRFDPSYRKARELIAAGELGDVELVVATTRDPEPRTIEPIRKSGGMFVDTTIHDLDSIRFLTGLEVEEVYVAGSNLIVPEGAGEGLVDTAVTLLRLQRGALAVITNSWRAVYGYDVTIELMGAAGKIAVGYEQDASVRRFTPQGVCHDHVYWFLERFEEAFVQEIAHFVECVALDQEPEVSGRDGRTALLLAQAAARSLRERRPVSLEEMS